MRNHFATWFAYGMLAVFFWACLICWFWIIAR